MADGRNLLIILTHGHRGDGLGGAGVWPIRTPHLDRLAADGLSLTAIAPSVDPVASEASMWSGLHPRQHGRWSQAQRASIGGWAAQLKAAGYYLSGIGAVGPIGEQLHQIHGVAGPDVLDDPDCRYLQAIQRKGHRWAVTEQRRQRTQFGLFRPADPIDEPTADVDGYIGEAAVRAVDELPRDRPWAMIVAFTGPGNDLPAPSMYRELVDRRTLADQYVPAAMPDIDRLGVFPYSRRLLQQTDADRVVQIREHYLARVCLIDACVGMLQKTLKRTGRAERTWTMLTADHGYTLGEHGLVSCRSFLGSGGYVPLWIVPPAHTDVSAASDGELRAMDGLITGGTFAASVCMLAKADLPPRGQEGSLLPGLSGEPVGEDAVIGESRTHLVLETLRHKVLFRLPGGEAVALFDLLDDPDERRNLIGTAKAEQQLDGLREQLLKRLLPLRAEAGPI